MSMMFKQLLRTLHTKPQLVNERGRFEDSIKKRQLKSVNLVDINGHCPNLFTLKFTLASLVLHVLPKLFIKREFVYQKLD
jgi:hypothetical protein